MNRFLVFAIAVSISSTAWAEEIPQDRIWTNATRGSQQLRNLEPEIFKPNPTAEEIEAFRKLSADERAGIEKKSLVRQLERAMIKKFAVENKRAGAGFVVKGIGRAALEDTARVLVEGDKPKIHFTADDDLSLVFYALAAQPGVGVESVVRNNTSIEVFYSIRSHGRLALSSNLTLIELGKLSPGRYEVKMLRSPVTHDEAGLSPVDRKMDASIVCRPFRFEVTK